GRGERQSVALCLRHGGPRGLLALARAVFGALQARGVRCLAAQEGGAGDSRQGCSRRRRCHAGSCRYCAAYPRRRSLSPQVNGCRYSGRPGHVESWFVRANDPAASRALWLKMTILAPLHGPAVAETWFIWFDGERGATLAHKDTVPIAGASFEHG